jgi:ribonuclease E
MQKKKILVDGVYKSEPRVVLLGGNDQIEAFEYEAGHRVQIRGNIYLAVVKRIEPALQAAFIDYGSDQKGFLPSSELSPEYYSSKSYASSKRPACLSPIAIDKLSLLDFGNERVSEEDEPEEDSFDLETLRGDCTPQANEPAPVEQTKSELPQIQDVLRKGQVVLVQAQKDARGSKGASFTTNISLAGRYCVVMPTRPHSHGISRKIYKSEERKKLRKLIDKLLSHSSSGVSIIMRTSCKRISLNAIVKDYEYTVRLWNRICKAALGSVAPSFIHMEEGIIQRVVRDMFDYSVGEVLVEGRAVYQQVLDCVSDIVPEEKNKVVQYAGSTPIFTKFGLEDSIRSLYQPVAELPSGGYLVINPAEGLTLIDVNSGKSNSQQNIEETAVKTNLEAAIEIARQLRLRDIAGLVVIDFIDMKDPANRALVKKAFDKSLQKDQARTSTGVISQFGLLEMSRQRMRSSFLESNTMACPHCKGKGLIRDLQTNDMLILRTIESEVSAHAHPINTVAVFGHMETILSLLNNRRRDIVRLEKKYGIEINLYHDPEATIESFSLEKITLDRSAASGSNDRWHTSPLLFAEDFKRQDVDNHESDAPPVNSRRMLVKQKPS